ncbi:MAG: hypothetical protein K2M93_09030 [Muribaculaceae bacterium]|nr:hypothetical protein [Muribaculaceae bacterium]
MKFLRFFLPIFLSIPLTFLSCSKAEEEPEPPKPDFITLLDGETLTANADGGEVLLRFTTNKDWSIEIPNTSEHFYGVLETRAGEAGEVKIPYTTLPNTTGKERSTTLRITAGRAKAEVKVVQEAVTVDLPSEAEVREYLVKLFNDTDGPNWRFKGKWCSDLPINQWGSEVKYENGKLSLILGEHDMKGDIDLSGCKALVSIRCSKNQIRRLNVSNCPLLQEVECINTGLEELDVTGCLSLTKLYASYNSLQHLDIGWCKTLNNLDVRECRLESLDLSECVSLQTLNCAINRIRHLEVPHRYRLIDCFCYENEISGTFDLSNSPQLQIVNCGENEITSLNVTDCPRLEWIYCYSNRITSLDEAIAGKEKVLTQIYCFSNKIEKLDVSGFYKLDALHCSDNGMTSLKFAGCKSLRWLYCSYNQLETLEFTGLDLEIFERLDCSYNRLREADIASLPKLLRLWCQGNRIGGEIPEHFDRLLEFEYDARYEYRPQTGTYTDRGYGWWYPGEPDKMSHSR